MKVRLDNPKTKADRLMRFAAVSASALSLLGVMSTASAQGFQLEEILVTAQRTEESLQDVPIAVTALSASQLEYRQVKELRDIANNVPNLNIVPVPGNGASMQVYMRGAAVESPGFNTSESPVGFYEDDVYRGRLSASSLDLSDDIERIEVLRGPQATLYGRNTLAGAVKVYTRTPSADNSWLSGSVAAGNWESKKITFSAGGEVANGFGASISALHNEQGEGFYVDETGANRNIGDFENQMVRGKLNWYGSDRAALVVSASYSKGENDGFNGIIHEITGEPTFDEQNMFQTPEDFSLELAERAVRLGQTDRIANDFYGIVTSYDSLGIYEQRAVSVDFSYDISDSLTFKSITGYFDMDDDTALDFNGGYYDSAFSFVTFQNVATGGVIAGEGTTNISDSDVTQWSQELQLLGSTDKMEWLTGLYYLKEEGTQFFAFQAHGDDWFSENYTTDTESYSAFAHMAYSLSDDLTLTVGGRYTKEDKNFLDTCIAQSPNFTTIFAFQCSDQPTWSVDLNESFTNTDWKLAIDYQQSDNVLLYASAATGFKSGGFQTLCFGNETCVLETYEPHTVLSWEAGVKSDMMDNRLRLNASAYLAQYEGVLGTVRAGFGSSLQNAGDADVYGIELDVSFAATADLTFVASMGTAESDYKTLNASSDVAISGATEVAGTPAWSGKVGVDFDRDISLFDSRLVMGADIYHSEEYYSDAINSYQVDAYDLVGGYIGLSDQNDKWSLILSGSNLMDDQIITSANIGSGANTRSVMSPRQYSLTLKMGL